MNCASLLPDHLAEHATFVFRFNYFYFLYKKLLLLLLLQSLHSPSLFSDDDKADS